MKLGETMQIIGAVAPVTGANGGLGKYYVEALQWKSQFKDIKQQAAVEELDSNVATVLAKLRA
jgi:hypothetical protein